MVGASRPGAGVLLPFAVAMMILMLGLVRLAQEYPTPKPHTILIIGIGAGLSGGFARDLNFQHSTIGVVNENAADGAFAYQLIGGVRANVTDRLFLFTEYKYFVANYQWESEFANGSRGPSFTLNYRSHIIAGGVGIAF